jgi:hypothetical protein
MHIFYQWYQSQAIVCRSRFGVVKEIKRSRIKKEKKQTLIQKIQTLTLTEQRGGRTGKGPTLAQLSPPRRRFTDERVDQLSRGLDSSSPNRTALGEPNGSRGTARADPRRRRMLSVCAGEIPHGGATALVAVTVVLSLGICCGYAREKGRRRQENGPRVRGRTGDGTATLLCSSHHGRPSPL